MDDLHLFLRGTITVLEILLAFSVIMESLKWRWRVSNGL
jgi:hypothetical protein